MWLHNRSDGGIESSQIASRSRTTKTVEAFGEIIVIRAIISEVQKSR